MILDRLLRLEAVLAGAVAANQPEFHIDYIDWTDNNEQTRPAPARGALNSTTDVICLAAAPANGPVAAREITSGSWYNKDTASVTLTVKTDDGTTERIIIRKVLATLETLHFHGGKGGAGWYVTNA